MRKGLKTISTIAIVVSLSYVNSYAQPLPPDRVPLDPFSWVMLGAGGAIAGKKYYNSRKKK